MKTLIGIIALIIVIGGGYWAYTQYAPAPEMAQEESERTMPADGQGVPAAGTYDIVSEESRVEWTAGKPLIAGYVHHGYFPISEGSITVGDNTASGSFTLDMNGLKVTSLGGGKAGKESQLEGHLKSDDFFDAETYPTATFEITSVMPAPAGGYTVTGNLTIKAVTKPVTIPANIYTENGQLHAHADFAIDRTAWGITYNSANFFEDLANNAIGDEVGLTLVVIANPVNQ